ncbi:carbohydrate esterase family 8 protein [Stipitochalara longipes BDJ]|nr:carbohydrate esterase family 8 protein [Stipitochalara longipes BDJ]
MARNLSFQALVLLFATFLSFVSGWDIGNQNDRHGCQAYSSDPLQGCDRERTVFVDIVSSQSKFKTVQSAVASLPNNTDTYIILIASGNYTEQVNVTRRGPTYLLGQTAHPTSQSYNTVNIIWAAIAVTGLDNAYTSTLTVAPNLNASLTGSGPTGFAVPAGTPFGCVDFRTYNLNFINDFAPYSDDPSLALSISYANGGFYYTGFYSYQDTVYVGKLGSAYIKNSEVAGETDFFYGFGTAWVENTSISLRSCGGGITAWKGTNTTFPNAYGIYIVGSNVHAANSSLNITGKCALGRPWNSQMRSIFAYTYLDKSILSTGFIDWNPSRYNNYTVQAEYMDYGPGYNVTGREIAKFDVQLTPQQWAKYSSPQKVFQYPDGRFGNTDWIDWSV